jgi:hypothetical protein
LFLGLSEAYGRQINDNILMATDLVKGYNRCKIDRQKAYDSVEWAFLKMVLHELGFPTIFVNWIMTCISTVSYSVLINGQPSHPFDAKKGLRQGDPLSPFLFALGMVQKP